MIGNGDPMYSIQKKYKICISIMYVGTLIRSIILRILNEFFNPRTLIADNFNAINMRFFWLRISNNIFSICVSIFLIGSIAMLYFFAKNTSSVPLYKIFLYFLTSIATMFGIAGLFAITDIDFWADYLFPLWSILIGMSILFFISVIINFIKFYKT